MGSRLQFLVVVTGHLNNLKKQLQRKDGLITDMYDSIMAFEVKLRLWKDQLRLCNVFFPHLKSPGHNLLRGYSAKFPVQYLCRQELERFEDFECMEPECL